MRTLRSQLCCWFGGLSLFLLALECPAGSVNVHVFGMVPGPTSSANDFHVQVTITQPFALGAPINFHNGPFSADPSVSISPTGFSVDWSTAVPITGGGPYDFQFDYTVDQLSTGVAFWTLNGSPVQNVAPGVLVFQSTPIEEPAILGLMVLAASLLLVQRLRFGDGARRMP